jgi:hypothetical protein
MPASGVCLFRRLGLTCASADQTPCGAARPPLPAGSHKQASRVCLPASSREDQGGRSWLMEQSDFRVAFDEAKARIAAQTHWLWSGLGALARPHVQDHPGRGGGDLTLLFAERGVEFLGQPVLGQPLPLPPAPRPATRGSAPPRWSCRSARTAVRSRSPVVGHPPGISGTLAQLLARIAKRAAVVLLGREQDGLRISLRRVGTIAPCGAA